MEEDLSAIAIDRNNAFVREIKKTENCRDTPLQVSFRMGGDITIEGHRSLKFSIIYPIFKKHGKTFKTDFKCSSVRLDCYEITERQKDIPAPFLPDSREETLVSMVETALGGKVVSTTSSGPIISLKVNLSSLESRAALSLFRCHAVLDIVIWKDCITVDLIKSTDNRSGLIHLKEARPELFREPACSEVMRARQLRRSTNAGKSVSRIRAVRRRKNSLFSWLWQ